MNMAALEHPVKLSPRSEAQLASLVGRITRFNVVQGRVFLDSCFDAQGVIVEHFGEHKRPLNQKFAYLSAVVGREVYRRTWAIRQLKMLPRLPIGLFANCYEWKPKRQAYSREGGVAIATFSGGLHRLAKIEIFSELISFDESDDENERIVHAEADRRICFTYDNGESIAFESDDCGNQPLLITGGERRPLDRTFKTLKSRLILTHTNVANPTSIGH
jgi:hypothetical protein